ncbi:glycosyltransferase [Paenibacillus sp. MMO-177]|uniref:glycosyltransferase n=1 Tax=Paenibacillus sp. MMO-177 TaxID=3081289 RepID=UPI0030175EA7
MNDPLVSVIIPVYNVESYLTECLESVMNQTYRNIEIIAINDGSTDGSLGILNQYKNDYNNIQVITTENSGMSCSRNLGIDYSRGKYIYFLDSDDYIHQDTLNILVDIMEKKNLDLIRFSAEPFVDGVNMVLEKNPYDFKDIFLKNKVYMKDEFLEVSQRAYSCQPCLYLVRKELISANNIRFRTGIFHEDELFSLEIFLNAGLSMYYPEMLYKRRYRSNSIMTSRSSQSLIKSFNSYCDVIMELNKLISKYTKPSQVRIIRKRIHALSIGLYMNKDIDKVYWEEKISSLNALSKWRKLYYRLRYKYGVLNYIIKPLIKSQR